LFGGWLGGLLGIRQTLVLTACGLLASSAVAAYSQLKRLKTLPASEFPEPESIGS